MKYCKYFVPLVALACTFGFADTAKAELGACCAPDGVCYDDHSYDTCTTGKSGDYQGDGTTCAEGCPDCDCDGIIDAKELADCVSYCVANMPPLNEQQCLDLVCDTNEDGAPDSSAPFGACPTTNVNVPWGNRCCDQSTGLHLPIDDGWDCTVDVCHEDGSVSHTPDDDFCTAAHSGVCWTAFCDPPGEPVWADGCDWEYDVVDTPCTGNGVGDCTEADTCDGQGTCLDNDLAGGTPCPYDSNECTYDRCSYSPTGTCYHDPVAKNGEDCTDDGNECTADYCSGGACTHPGWPMNGQPCTDDSNDCTDDVCQATQCTHPPLGGGIVCGVPPAGDCDLQDTCGGGGNAGVCMDRVVAAATTCRAKNGICDLKEVCDGASHDCPADAVRPDTYTCRSKNGDCDVADKCDGVGKDCPADAFEPSTTECNPNPNPSPTPPELTCGIAEFCPGDGPDCPPDTWVAAGTVCRPYQTECDVEEVCEGDSSFCPDDVVDAMDMDPCTPDRNQCTNDVCWKNNCVHPAVPDYDPCVDGEICTTLDRCESGVCVGHNWDPCTDSVYCTYDECVAGVGCNNTYNGGPCGDLLVKLVPTGSGPIEDSYQKGCFTVEVFVMDASDDPQGINCAFVNLTLGDANCPLSVMDLADPIYPGNDYQVFVNDDDFPDFNTWWVEPPMEVLDFGGCTNDPDVGIGDWVLLGTVDVIAPNKVCDAAISAAQSGYTDSSLIGQGYATAQQQQTVSPISMHCWGDLYDNTNAWGFVDAGDLSYFAPCWDQDPVSPGCEDFDYDMSGSVGPGDLGFFATAWQEYVCAGGVVIPLEQMRCNGYGWGPGGAASVSGNGAMLDEDGNVVVVHVPPASVEMIKSFGLTVPERLLAPPDNDRLTPKANKRPVRSR